MHKRVRKHLTTLTIQNKSVFADVTVSGDILRFAEKPDEAPMKLTHVINHQREFEWQDVHNFLVKRSSHHTPSVPLKIHLIHSPTSPFAIVFKSTREPNPIPVPYPVLSISTL